MLLTYIFLILFFSLIVLFIVPKQSKNILQFISATTSGFVLILASYILSKFDTNVYYFQELITYKFDSQFFFFS